MCFPVGGVAAHCTVRDCDAALARILEADAEAQWALGPASGTAKYGLGQ